MEIVSTQQEADRDVSGDLVDKDILKISSCFSCNGVLDHTSIDVGHSFEWECFLQMEINRYATNMESVLSPSLSVYFPL